MIRFYLFALNLIFFGSKIMVSSNESFNTTERNTPLDLICLESFPDAMVVTDDKTIYIFSHKYFWIVDFDDNENRLYVSDNNARLIVEEWHNLTNDLEYGFTIERSAFGNPIAGHTIFVKNGKYYRYYNKKYNGSGDLKYWNMGQNLWDDYRYVIIVRNSSLVLLNSRTQLVNPISKGKTFVFDDSNYPDAIEDFVVLTNRLNIDFETLKLLFPLPFGDKYLALFKFGRIGFYCILNGLRSKCNYEPIYKMFNCSTDLIVGKEKDWIYYMWTNFNLEVNEVVLIISGTTFAVLLTNIFLFILSFNRYIELQ